MPACSDDSSPESDSPQPEPVLYLSDDWLARADQLLQHLKPVPDAVTIGVRVTGGPEGDRRYRLVLGPDRVGLDQAEAAGATMSLTWDDATAIAQGQSSAQRAFLDGRLKLGGDTGLLLGHQDELNEIDDRLAQLRAATTYQPR